MIENDGYSVIEERLLRALIGSVGDRLGEERDVQEVFCHPPSFDGQTLRESHVRDLNVLHGDIEQFDAKDGGLLIHLNGVVSCS